MLKINKSLTALAVVVMSSHLPLDAKPTKSNSAKNWKKPPSVFNSYRPSKVPYKSLYSGSQSLPSRGGTARERFNSMSKKKFYGKKSMTVTATGYTDDPSENGGYTITATGLPINRGAIAVDPRVIPLGTYLYVEGYGFGFACDTGGAIKGNKIDLCFSSDAKSRQWGRKKVKIWILAAK